MVKTDPVLLGNLIVSDAQTQITSILTAVGNGDAGAAEKLWRIVYDDLHRVAHARIVREGRRADLQTTVLVQEAYLRLVGSKNDGANLPANRRHFFAAAANAMRQFLVDDARKRGRQKRGGGRQPVGIGDAAALATDPAEVLALDEALVKLREHDPPKAEIVQLRYYAGLSIDETAEVLGLSPRQVDKEWRFAKAWLHKQLC